jgi:hypothetical protein
MPRGIKKVVTPPPAPRVVTKEERIENCVWQLKYHVKAAKELRDKLIANMLKDDKLYNAAYEIRWLQGKAKTLQVGLFCEAILENLEDPAQVLLPEERLENSLRWLEGRKECWYPENSTSPYSNAAHNEEYDALRDLVRDLRSYVKHIKESEILV